MGSACHPICPRNKTHLQASKIACMNRPKTAKPDWNQSQETDGETLSGPNLASTDQDSIGHRLRIVYRHLDELKPDPRNPGVHSRRQIKKLAKLIARLGFNVPVLVG